MKNQELWMRRKVLRVVDIVRSKGNNSGKNGHTKGKLLSQFTAEKLNFCSVMENLCLPGKQNRTLKETKEDRVHRIWPVI